MESAQTACGWHMYMYVYFCYLIFVLGWLDVISSSVGWYFWSWVLVVNYGCKRSPKHTYNALFEWQIRKVLNLQYVLNTINCITAPRCCACKDAPMIWPRGEGYDQGLLLVHGKSREFLCHNYQLYSSIWSSRLGSVCGWPVRMRVSALELTLRVERGSMRGTQQPWCVCFPCGGVGPELQSCGVCGGSHGSRSLLKVPSLPVFGCLRKLLFAL